MRKELTIVALTAAVPPAMVQHTKDAVSGVSDMNDKKGHVVDEVTDNTLDCTMVTNGKFALEGKDSLYTTYE